jgi:hypothetical protein
MRFSSQASAATIALVIWFSSDALDSAIAASAIDQRAPRLPSESYPLTRLGAPLELQPFLRKPVTYVKKISKARRMKKLKRHLRRTRTRIWKEYYAVPLPPRIVRSIEQTKASSRSGEPPRPTKPFDGPYAGLAFGHDQTGAIEPSPYGALIPFQPYPGVSRSQTITLWSFAGFNKQFNSTVAGIEADLGIRLPSSKQSHGPYGALTASFRGRVYGTGGLVIADFKKSDNGLRYDSLHGGWTAGIGIESYVTPTLLLRAEYLYSRFPALRFDTHAIRAGFAIKF